MGSKQKADLCSRINTLLPAFAEELLLWMSLNRESPAASCVKYKLWIKSRPNSLEVVSENGYTHTQWHVTWWIKPIESIGEFITELRHVISNIYMEFEITYFNDFIYAKYLLR